MSIFPKGWALQKPTQTIEPHELETMLRAGVIIPTLKRDGNRAHIVKSEEGVRIYSRNGTLNWTDRLGHIVHDWKHAPTGYMMDVELHTQEEGTFSFQDAINNDPERLMWSAFDMLKLDGSNASQGYGDRYDLMRKLIMGTGLDETPSAGAGVEHALAADATYDDVLAQIEELGVEGMVMWHKDGPHALNLNGNTKRGKSWKVKVRQTEDLVVTGWNPNKGDPSLGVGSLELKRMNEAGALTRAGKVGSFDKSFDRHAPMTRAGRWIVEVSHYGLDENGNMSFPKVEKVRDDLLNDFGLLKAA